MEDFFFWKFGPKTWVHIIHNKIQVLNAQMLLEQPPGPATGLAKVESTQTQKALSQMVITTLHNFLEIYARS